MHILRLIALAFSLGLGLATCFASHAQSNSPATTADSASKNLRTIVSGIIEYSQWPNALPAVSLCISGSPVLLQDLQTHGMRSRHGQVLIKAAPALNNALIATECSVLYIGQDTSDDLATAWIHALIGKPVITIRENPFKCSDGTLICLYTKPNATPTFEVNLDSVSRSGIRLNPWVLTLMNHPAQKSGHP